MINIERNILCSILEHNFIGNDKKIFSTILNVDYFSDKHHKLFASSINRLRELDEPIDSDMVRLKLQSVKKWDFYLEDSLLKIMGANPLGTHDLFMQYYKVLEKHNVESERFRLMRSI